jgi:pimeloyl-ACP methyl ester carboxylesterase
MVTFILPGYSAHNKSWAEEVAKKIRVDGEIRPVFWDHWTDTDKHLKPKEKSRLIIDVSHGDTVNIIAKSVGTFVSAYIVAQIPEKINKVILCGIPSTSDERLKIFREAFESFPAEKVICFQNEHDPFASPSEVRGFMKKVNSKIKIKAMSGSGHEYPYFSEFDDILNA